MIASKLYSISFFKSEVLLQQSIALLEGFCILFKCVLHHPEENDRMRDIQPSWVDVTIAAGPILLKRSRETKWWHFGTIFKILSGTENCLTESYFFFLQKYFK